MIVDQTHLGYVYSVTNNINGKTYIGKHTHKNEEKWETYMGSGRAILSAIKKYGKKSFTKELLCYASSIEELSEKENYYINNEVSRGKSEYNILQSSSESLKRKTREGLSKHPILDWYFEEKLSTREISEKIDFSQPTVLAYIKSSGDHRLHMMKPRTPLRKREKPVPTEESRRKIREALAKKPKVKCEKCCKYFLFSVINVHRDSCKGPISCSFEGCLTIPRKKTAKYCINHKHRRQREE